MKGAVLYGGTFLAVLLAAIAGGMYGKPESQGAGGIGITTAFLFAFASVYVLTHPRVSIGLFVASAVMALIGATADAFGGLWFYLILSLIGAYVSWTAVKRAPSAVSAPPVAAPYTGG